MRKAVRIGGFVISPCASEGGAITAASTTNAVATIWMLLVCIIAAMLIELGAACAVQPKICTADETIKMRSCVRVW